MWFLHKNMQITMILQLFATTHWVIFNSRVLLWCRAFIHISSDDKMWCLQLWRGCTGDCDGEIPKGAADLCFLRKASRACSGGHAGPASIITNNRGAGRNCSACWSGIFMPENFTSVKTRNAGSLYETESPLTIVRFCHTYSCSYTRTSGWSVRSFVLVPSIKHTAFNRS